jgi:hypothetical protein
VKDFDPRLTPARPDLAAQHLRGKVEATRFVKGELREVVAPQAPLRRAPMPDAPLDTEALKGEQVTVYETTGEGWAWAQLASDGYVGFMPAGALGPPGPPATHKVAALRTLIFPGPSIKLPPIDGLSFGARLVVERIDGALALTSVGYVPAGHLCRAADKEIDFVAVAERFLGTPYLWGGKTALGLDCSGLVQLALNACGLACPRDSDMQETALGTAVATNADFSGLRRGDLLFWKGHVAIVRDGLTLLHANAFHMAVAIEPIKDAVRRIRAAGAGAETASARRLPAVP